MIDAGIGAPDHVDAIAGVLDGRALARVLVTHGHRDHASGVPALRARWPGLMACKWLTDGDDATWTGIADGDRIRAGDEELIAVHTPGHAVDHLCFAIPRTREIFGGDMVIAGTTVVIPAGRGGHLGDYLDSLARLAGLSPSRIYPGHGPIIDRPLELIEQYVAHRALRERQVLACLKDGVTDVEAIVARIYPGLAPGLLSSARLTVQAHLEKLDADAERLR